LIPIHLLAAYAAIANPQASVTLSRVFAKNERLAYNVESSVHAEQRGRGLQTWIPDDYDLRYGFTMDVETLKSDGVAVVRYKRPTLTEIRGETFEKEAVTKVNKLNWDLRLTVSPANKVLDMKDLTPKKDPKKAKKSNLNLRLAGGTQIGLQAFLGQFVQEVYRLSMFAGSLESSLDLAPGLPFDAVKVGDTWKTTVGYTPQKLKGNAKPIVQRLDYTYTYKGLVDGAKGKVHRVEAVLGFDSDLADYIHQTFEVTADQTGLQKIPLRMNAKIVYNLDPKTRHTLSASAESDASFQVLVKQYPDDPVQEEKIKGRSSITLVGRKIVAVAKKK